MKSIIVILATFLTVAARNCNKELAATPPCILQKIAAIRAQPKWNPPAEVHEYLYQGKKLYYFTSNCCDQYNEVYDDQCNLICAPSGGITGKGDGKCADFLQQAKELRLVWKDDR